MKTALYKPASLRTCVPAYLLVASAALSTSAYASGVAAASEYFEESASATTVALALHQTGLVQEAGTTPPAGTTPSKNVSLNVKKNGSKPEIAVIDKDAESVNKTGVGDAFVGVNTLENAKTFDVEAGRLVLTKNGEQEAAIKLGDKDAQFTLKKGAVLAGSGSIEAKDVQLKGTISLDEWKATKVPEDPTHAAASDAPKIKIEQTSDIGHLTIKGNTTLTGATINVDFDSKNVKNHDDITVEGNLTVGKGNKINLNNLVFGEDGQLSGDLITARKVLKSDTKADKFEDIALTVGGKSASKFDFLEGTKVDVVNTTEKKAIALTGGLRWYSNKKQEKGADGKAIPVENAKYTAHGDFTIDAGRVAIDSAIQDSTVVKSKEDSASKWDGKSLTKLGKGTLVLNGANGYTGTTTVKQGTLMVGDKDHSKAAIDSAVTVEKGATLAGLGTIEKDVTVNGRLEGSLTIKKELTLKSGAVLASSGMTAESGLTLEKGSVVEVKTSAKGTDAKVTVTGTAKVDGARVHVVRDGKFDTTKKNTYALLKADKLEGKLSLDNDWAFLKGELQTDKVPAQADHDLVKLTLERNGASYASIAHTSNQQGVGAGITALEAADAGHVLVQDVLFMNERQARAAYDSLSGEIHGSTRASLMGDQHLSRAVLQQAPKEAGLWMTPWGQRSTLDADGNAAGVDVRGKGFAAGADVQVSDSAKVGAFMAYEDQRVKSNARQSRSDVEGYSAGAYVAAQAGMVQLRGGVAYSALDIDTQRDIAAGSVHGTLKSSHKAYKTQVFAEAALPVAVSDDVTVSPYLGLSHAWLRAGAVQEHGNAAALNVNSQTDKALFTTLGVRAALALPTQAPVSITADLGWTHAAGDVNGKTQHSFAGAKSGFDVKGRGLVKNTVVTGLGLQTQVGARTTVGVGYEGQFGSGLKNHNATARVQVKF